MKTAEQESRDLLERIGIEDAQSFTAGDLVELANLIAFYARHHGEKEYGVVYCQERKKRVKYCKCDVIGRKYDKDGCCLHCNLTINAEEELLYRLNESFNYY